MQENDWPLGRNGLMPNDVLLHNNSIMRAVDQIAKGAGRLGLPLYSCACSKRTYTQHQLLVLLVAREMLAKSYRETIDVVSLMTPLLRRLRLRSMPHFTTLQKFSLRLETHVLDGLLFTLASCADDEVDAIIDSTGMQSGSASYYYIRTMSLRRDSKGTELRAVRQHIKLTLVIDARTMTILSIVTTLGPGPDFQHLRPALQKAVEHGATIVTIVADKGYDSESNRRFVVHELGAEAHIPVRNVKRTGENSQGRYRRRQLRVFDEARYRRRALVETVNSMLKRRSSIVRSRSERGQYIELALRAVAHNAKRATTLAQTG
jgi:IS5 family transposase